MGPQLRPGAMGPSTEETRDHWVRHTILAPNAGSLGPSAILRPPLGTGGPSRRLESQKEKVDRAARPPPSTNQEAAVRTRGNPMVRAHPGHAGRTRAQGYPRSFGYSRPKTCAPPLDMCVSAHN